MNSGKQIAIIGGGPSGLMAAEILGKAGCQVTLYDKMPTLGRKFLMAGRGGLNLTHSEPLEQFIQRYGEAASWLAPHIRHFSPSDLRAWCEGLGQETFVGSSGRVFPRSMKGAPLLRAWLGRLNELGVTYAPRHCWHGWEGKKLRFIHAEQQTILVEPNATLLALGGASWPRLGSDGSWVDILTKEGVITTPLRPANCGFTVEWSEYFSSRFAGEPLKPVRITHNGIAQQGEVMLTKHGVEGGAIYALSSALREAIAAKGTTTLTLDVRPGMTQDALQKKLSLPRGSQSFSNYLRKAGLSPLVIALLREVSADDMAKKTAAELANLLKNMPLTLTGVAGLERAISTAGGIERSAIQDDFMLRAKPGVFVAGEMLDWEAPTGGYLLQACFSTAVAAARGMLGYCD